MRLSIAVWALVAAAGLEGASPSSASGGADPCRDMALIPGGLFRMGVNDGQPEESPVHEVSLPSFCMDRYQVTTAEFGRFVKTTAYKTTAERAGWSGVFRLHTGAWDKVNGADWRHPDGPGSTSKPDEPVTQVSWEDAAAYARWANKRLPTEAEFEYAARGGLVGKKYAWGDELRPQGEDKANLWQGTFPSRNTAADGFAERAPVGSFPANAYRLYDMTGNVWEWCADWFDVAYYGKSPRYNPRGPGQRQDRVIRGGSWLCSEDSCQGYRVAARNHTAPDSGLNNLGFRCARDVCRPGADGSSPMASSR